MKKNSVVWYGLAIFLAAAFNVGWGLSQHSIGVVDVVLFIFSVMILMLSVLTRFSDE